MSEEGGRGDTRKAAQYNNIANRPLVTGNEDQLVLGETFFFPELHCLLGVVAKLMKEFERSNVFQSEGEGRTYILNWEKGVGVYRQTFHGSTSYNGANSKKLLENVASLERDLKANLVEEDGRLATAMKFCKAIGDFSDVVDACFGMELNPVYETFIQNFSCSYRDLGISVPVKVHLIEKHLSQFLKMFGEEHGLGFYSEQSMESFHNDSKADIIDEKIVPVDHPRHGEQLMNVMVRINGKHI